MQKEDKQTNNHKKRGLKRSTDILRVALTILTQQGYGELSMRRIAKEIGISLGNLQYYFPNKKVLIQKLLEDYLDQTMLKIQERSSLKVNSIEEQFDMALNVSFLEQSSKEACQVFYELWALATRDKEVKAALESFYETYCSIVAGYVEHINPSLGKETVRKRAAIIVAMLEGLSLYSLWENSTLPTMAELEGEFKQIVKFIMA